MEEEGDICNLNISQGVEYILLYLGCSCFKKKFSDVDTLWNLSHLNIGYYSNLICR